VRPVVGRSPERVEVDRVLSLPVRSPPDAEDVEVESFLRISADAFVRGERLFPEQVHALKAWEEAGGGLFGLAVGMGKTGLCLMIAKDALARGIARKVVLLVPVTLLPGIVERHVPEWRDRVGLPFSIHHFAGLASPARLRLARSDAPGLYVLPYSLLSTSDSVALLAALDPGLVIADEAHRLKNLRSALSRRLFAWARGRDPRPALVAMSGSLMTRGIMEFHHLADAALHDCSPLPRTASQAYSWSMVIDAGADPPAGMGRSVFGPLLDWAGEAPGPDAERRAFRRRLSTSPGVVLSSGGRPPCSLLVREAPCELPCERLMALYRRVEDDYVTPDGEPIDHAIHAYKWLRELSAGFYNSLVWPTPEHLAKARGVPLPEAAELLRRARAHHDAQAEHHRALRRYFQSSAEPGLDTPREVGRAISEGRLGGDLAASWRAMRDLDFPGRPERLAVPVRTCDRKVLATLRWAREARSGIVWTYHQEVGRWIWEVLRDFGLDPLHCPGGDSGPIEAVGDPLRGGRGDRIVVASMSSHGTGRNLQAFERQLVVQWPRSAGDAEQLLGRLHRTGQRADEVVADVLVSTEHDLVTRAACLSDAACLDVLMGPQRVIYSDWDPLPRVYTVDFLRARGLQPRDLSPDARELVRRRFGSYVR